MKQKCPKCGYVLADSEKGDEWEWSCVICVCGKTTCWDNDPPKGWRVNKK